MRKTIKDISFVSDIIADESVFWTAKDDGVTDPYSFVRDSLHNPGHIWLSPFPDTLLLFKGINLILAEMHIAIKSGPARINSRTSCIDACRWMFRNSPCEKIITYIAESNILAVSLASECGMIREGYLAEAMKINGINEGLIILGATKANLTELHGG